ncbi:uncharacterized protein LOC121734424 [Aricia agestis]|uniref:uncharacterized protein LOC121734424 n=1 Tax=Aricia agestis TaxID=91739 RepID=UPI001C206B60|nr:uncharacterized protein LOC121734424 [Aricia agestis]
MSESDGDKNVTRRAQRAPEARDHTIRDGSDTTSSSNFKIKVPPFSPDDPELWFAMIEGQFDVQKITDDHIKFTNVVTNLDIQYAKSVKDVIVAPPSTDRYEKIKQELIKRLSASHEKKVKQLLIHEELGDRKPSQFLRHLQDLGGHSVSDNLLKSIWTNRLPHNIQTVLVSRDSDNLEQLADLADRIQELASPYTVAAMSTGTSQSSSSNEIAELKKMVKELTLKLESHTRASCCTTSRSRPRERNRSSSRQRQRSSSNYNKHPLCWYHAKFGKKAHRCIKPCDFVADKVGNAFGSQ